MGRTYQSTVVEAPADQVWRLLRNFHDMSWAPGVIESCTVVGDRDGDQPGARRVLNGVFHETLQAVDDLERSLKYSIDDGPSPVSKAEVSRYIGQLRVLAVTDTDTSFVEWHSSWHGNDAAATEFCHSIYVALLDALKKHFA